MPLTCEEVFVARLQRNNRVQVPVLVRWKHKLEAGEVLDVTVYAEYNDQTFYCKLSKDGRFTVPKIVIEKIEAKTGSILDVVLHPS